MYSTKMSPKKSTGSWTKLSRIQRITLRMKWTSLQWIAKCCNDAHKMNQWNWSKTSKDGLQWNLSSKIWMVNFGDFTYMLGVSQIDNSSDCTTECGSIGIVGTQCIHSHHDDFSLVLHWKLRLKHSWSNQFSLFFLKNVILENVNLFSNVNAILVDNNEMHNAACLLVTLMLLQVPVKIQVNISMQ